MAAGMASSCRIPLLMVCVIHLLDCLCVCVCVCGVCMCLVVE